MTHFWIQTMQSKQANNAQKGLHDSYASFRVSAAEEVTHPTRLCLAHFLLLQDFNKGIQR